VRNPTRSWSERRSKTKPVGGDPDIEDNDPKVEARAVLQSDVEALFVAPE